MPEVPRDPSGRAIGPVDGIEQSNLITDYGLDQIAVLACYNVSTGSAWRGYMGVGTGSTAPDPTDTALDAEAQRAASAGTYGAGSREYSQSTDDDEWVVSAIVNRVVTMTADRNLTEFGFATSSSGANYTIRELFRDALGDPVTISLLNGKSVKVEHTLRIVLPWPAAGNLATINIDEYDAANALIASTPYDVVYGAHVEANNDLHRNLVLAAWDPSPQTATYIASVGLRRINKALTWARSDGWIALGDTDPYPTLAALVSTTQPAYTPGSYERPKRGLVGTGLANDAWYGYLICATSGSFGKRSGIVVLFDDPATYTKVDTDTLQAGILSTWARATEGSGS